MIAAAAVLIIAPEECYDLIIIGLGVMFIVIAISTLSYYFTMARFMVGGRISLFQGIAILDLGVVTMSLTNVQHYYILLYLIIIHAIAGLIGLGHALESKRAGASWRLKSVHGIMDIAMAVICIIFIRRMSIAVIVFGIGLIYSGVMRIVSACRRTAFVYIQ